MIVRFGVQSPVLCFFWRLVWNHFYPQTRKGFHPCDACCPALATRTVEWFINYENPWGLTCSSHRAKLFLLNRTCKVILAYISIWFNVDWFSVNTIQASWLPMLGRCNWGSWDCVLALDLPLLELLRIRFVLQWRRLPGSPQAGDHINTGLCRRVSCW